MVTQTLHGRDLESLRSPLREILSSASKNAPESIGSEKNSDAPQRNDRRIRLESVVSLSAMTGTLASLTYRTSASAFSAFAVTSMRQTSGRCASTASDSGQVSGARHSKMSSRLLAASSTPRRSSAFGLIRTARSNRLWFGGNSTKTYRQSADKI